jgi:hypothetical protein
VISPADLIANLDAALIEVGEIVTIRRYTAPTGNPRPSIDIAGVLAAVRALKADELVGTIDQTWSRVVFSPTKLGPLLPLRKSDKIIVQGRERNIELPQPIFVQGTLVRMVALVGG